MKKHSLVSGKSKIAIYSSNCYEYDAIIIGGYYQNICNVSLYDTFGEEAVKYILEHVRNSTISDLHNKASHFGGKHCSSNKTSGYTSSKLVKTCPNVIVINTDDMSWADVTINNPSKLVPTPNIDKLVSKGINFRDGHSCTSLTQPYLCQTLTVCL